MEIYPNGASLRCSNKAFPRQILTNSISDDEVKKYIKLSGKIV